MGRFLDWLLGDVAPTDDLERDADHTWEAHEWIALNPELDQMALPTDPKTALSIAAFYRGIRIKADLISTLPLRAEVGDFPVDTTTPILEEPTPGEDRQTTISRLVSSLILCGEIVAVLANHDAEGFPGSVTVVDPRLAAKLPNGRWMINGTPYERDEILHHVPFALPGWTRGVGVLELHRRVVHGEIRQTEYQRRFYDEAAVPSVVIQAARPDASVDEMREYEAWWNAQLRSRRKAVVVGGNDSVEPLGLSNRDAQYIETRQFALGEIADLVGLPRYYLGANPAGSNTYSNVHDERRALIDIYLRGELYAIERAFTRILPDGIKAKFDPASFLRLDPKQTVEVVAAQTWLTDDEKRQIMGYSPRPTSPDNPDDDAVNS